MEETPRPDLAKMLMTPAIIGAYAVAGIYVARAFRGTQTPIDLGTVAAVAGTSVVAAVIAPKVLPKVTCPKSESAPLIEAVISSALTYGMISALSGSTNASMFVPVQFGSHLAGTWVSNYMEKMKVEEKAPEIESSHGSDSAW